jgi:hypothetical protein
MSTATKKKLIKPKKKPKKLNPYEAIVEVQKADNETIWAELKKQYPLAREYFLARICEHLEGLEDCMRAVVMDTVGFENYIRYMDAIDHWDNYIEDQVLDAFKAEAVHRTGKINRKFRRNQ